KKAAKLLEHLSVPRTLAALRVRTLEKLLRAQAIRISKSTARRLLPESTAAPPSKLALRTLATTPAKIKKALRRGDAGAYDIGKLVDRVATLRLHRLTAPRTLADWADTTFPRHGYRTLARYRRIAKSFTKRQGALERTLAVPRRRAPHLAALARLAPPRPP